MTSAYLRLVRRRPRVLEVCGCSSAPPHFSRCACSADRCTRACRFDNSNDDGEQTSALIMPRSRAASKTLGYQTSQPGKRLSTCCLSVFTLISRLSKICCFNLAQNKDRYNARRHSAIARAQTQICRSADIGGIYSGPRPAGSPAPWLWYWWSPLRCGNLAVASPFRRRRQSLPGPVQRFSASAATCTSTALEFP